VARLDLGARQIFARSGNCGIYDDWHCPTCESKEIPRWFGDTVELSIKNRTVRSSVLRAKPISPARRSYASEGVRF
jgi:hypothetical protein